MTQALSPHDQDNGDKFHYQWGKKKQNKEVVFWDRRTKHVKTSTTQLESLVHRAHFTGDD